MNKNNMELRDSVRETNIGAMWFNGDYTENQARRSARLQALNFKAIEHIYGRMYEQEQCANEGYYHD